MRALLQRVSKASVTVAGEITGQIEAGLLVLLGVGLQDTDADAAKLAHKVTHLRVFEDSVGKMNLSLLDVRGEMLVVSQFTLYAETAKGNRPSYSQAARPEVAGVLYEAFIGYCRGQGVRVSTGIFQSDMQVMLINDGPVTLMCET
jgi:D-tyrosyl-tRNA(Tyr) deacylase